MDYNIKNNTQSFLFVSGSSGNVGIGSISPRQKLEVDGGIYGQNIGVNSIAPTATLEVKAVSDTNPLAVTNSAAGDYFVVASNGNVGIGTLAPTTKLEIGSGRGALKVGLDNYQYASIQIISDHNNYLELGFSNTVGYNFIQANDGNSANGWGLILQPNASGNVGVGTSKPFAKFAVDGAIYGGLTEPSHSAVSMASSGDAMFGGDVEIDGALYVDGYLYGNGSQLTNLAGGISGQVANYVPRATAANALTQGTIYDNAQYRHRHHLAGRRA